MSEVTGIVPEGAAAPSAGQQVPMREAVRVWARVAILSFGGPAGQIAVMHRILVEEKRWISESRFMHALNYCMLLPGPEAQQLATYVGWLMHKTRGGLIAGGLFIVPGIVSIIALSIVYALWGKVGFVSAAFFGLKAAVLAIVVEAVVRIGKRALKSGVMQALAAAAFVAIFFFAVPFPLIIASAALVGFVGGGRGHPAFEATGHGSEAQDAHSVLGSELPDHARPNTRRSLRVAATWLALWLVPVAALLLALGPDHVFSKIAIFFSEMAVVTFGVAYAVLAYVAQQAVETYHWLGPGEMLDGLGMAETTPGPLIMVLQFVGFIGAFREAGALPPLLAGVLGGLLATCHFHAVLPLDLPCCTLHREAARNAALSGALAAITAAVVGVVLNLAIWFAIHTVFRTTFPVRGFGLSFEAPLLASVDVWSLALAIAAAVVIFRFKVGMIPTLAGCCLAGVALYFAGAI